MIRCAVERGELSVAGDELQLDGWSISLQADGRSYDLDAAALQVESRTSDGLDLTWRIRQIGLTWRMQLRHDAASIILRSQLVNESTRDIALGTVTPLRLRRPVGLGRDGDEILCLAVPAGCHDRRVYDIAHEQSPRESRVKFQFYNRTQRRALQIGFITFQTTDTRVSYERAGNGDVQALEAVCDFGGWSLAAGQVTDVETLIVQIGDDPHAQLRRWAEQAGVLAGARRWPAPPLGWIGWAWVDGFTVERYRDVVLRNARAIRRRLAGFGLEYIWVSLGNIDGATPGNWLEWNEKLFPGGPESLARELSELGYKLGLWCAPFYLCPTSRHYDAMKDAIGTDADGKPLVARDEWPFGDAGMLPKEQRPCVYGLDPTHPRTLEMLRRTFATYRDWGVRYYMLDFLEAGAGAISTYPQPRHADGRFKPTAEAYVQAMRVIRESAGDDTYFLSSTGPTLHNAGLCDGVRVGCDFGEGRALFPDSYFYPATFVINGTSYWTGAGRAWCNQAAAAYTHNRLYINDSGNVLTVDKPMPLEDARINVTLHALSGGPSMLGDDIETLDDERLALIKKTLPRSREIGLPIDLFDRPFPQRPTLMHRKVRRPWGEYDLLAIYNFDDEPLRQSVPLSRLGFCDDDELLVFEFWNSQFVGRFRKTLNVIVPGGSARVYRLVCGIGAAPVLLGTDMHVTMGEMEIESCVLDGRTLSGQAVRPAGQRGSVFLHAPQGLRVVNPAGYYIAMDARDQSLIVRVPLEFNETGKASWAVTFAPLADGPGELQDKNLA